MINLESKIGAAHFEMIISFMFFLSFVLFLFAVLTPYTSSPISATALDRLQIELFNTNKVDYSKFYIKEDQTTGCFIINLNDNSFDYSFTNSIVKNINEVVINSELSSSGSLEIDDPGNDMDYFVSFSPEFNSGVVDNPSCVVSAINVVGSINEREVLSYKRLNDTKTSYKNDYKKLKDDLKVPTIFDFEIVIEEYPELSMTSRLIPDAAHVSAKNYLMEVLEEDGTLTNARFTIKVW